MGRGRRPLGKARSLAHPSVITVREDAFDPATTGSMFLTPDRLIAAGIHSPMRTSSTENTGLWPVLMKWPT